MNTEIENRKIVLSTLWIFVTLNYLYCDLIGLMDANLLKQYLTGTVDGLNMSEVFLLSAAILMEIPIAMVLLSRVLKYKSNRWANIIASSIKTIVMILTLFAGTPTLYYLFFAIIEISTTSFILWYAWRWTSPEENTNYQN
ncbi:DUF6326 family protein [Halanaerocella petrolearia]